MKPVLAALLFFSFFSAAHAQELKSLRGKAPIAETNPADTYRMERHDHILPRNHPWQPPIIPHVVKGYQITKNVNTCMTCHSKKASLESGATPVGKSHYLDRDGKELQTVSARRYFCLQCHTPQFDAEALVPNTFRGPLQKEGR